MSRRSRKQIDKDEKKIVAALQKNGKERIDDLSKHCKFSRQKVWRIIKRLEKNKVIWGYHAVVDKEKIGVKAYLILIKRTPKPVEKTFLDSIVNNALYLSGTKMGVKLDSMFYVHGPYDWVLSITAIDIKQVKQFCELVAKAFLGHVADIQILEVLCPVKERCIDNPNPESIRDFFLTE